MEKVYIPLIGGPIGTAYPSPAPLDKNKRKSVVKFLESSIIFLHDGHEKCLLSN